MIFVYCTNTADWIFSDKHGPILEKVSSKIIIDDFESDLFEYSHRFDLKTTQNCMKESRER